MPMTMVRSLAWRHRAPLHGLSPFNDVCSSSPLGRYGFTTVLF